MLSLLETLPFDIWHQIAEFLEPHDYLLLGRAYPQLPALMKDEMTARKVAKLRISSTAEGKLAQTGQLSYREALESVYRVREAVATAQPFSVSLIAYGESFLFNQGVLCYLDRGVIRVLDVHHAAEEECAVNLSAISRATLPVFSEAGARDKDARFTLLNYADGIVACLCEVKKFRESWLLAIQVCPHAAADTSRVRLAIRVQRTTQLFVRHNDRFLFYGTHSGVGRNCQREWLVSGVDLTEDKHGTAPPTIQLRNFPGLDIGSTVCFEIKNGYFYAISNQTGHFDQEIDWTSYYVCLRFPLNNPHQIQWKRIWRRQHREGPICDTWTDISLQTDDSTGELMIVECRREWLNGASENSRTYYTQPLNWCDDDEACGDSSPSTPTTTTGSSIPPDTATAKENEEPSSPLEPVSNPGLPAFVPLRVRPDDPLTALLDSNCTPNYEPPKKRVRRHCHPEYSDAESAVEDRKDFIHSRTKYSTYNQSASALVDLVNDPPPQVKFFSRPPDRLRLRIGSRKRKSPIDTNGDEVEAGLLFPPEYLNPDGSAMDMSEERFESRGIRLWPPNDAPPELLSLLCPSGRAGKVEAASDERCLVYSTEPPEPGTRRRPIILISFDPSISFRTLLPLNATPLIPELCRSGREDQVSESQRCEIDAEKVVSSVLPTAIRRQKPKWAAVHKAMYLDINRGYWVRNPNALA